MISEYIKTKLNVLLNEKSLSQKVLAKNIGVHQTQISMFATGTRSVTMEFAEKFFRAYPMYFKEKTEQNLLSEPSTEYLTKNVKTGGVPYFVNENAADLENDIIMIPGFEDCDRWEVVFNRDLMPDFMPGEIIGLVRTDEQEPILWDKPYVVKLKGLNLLRIPRESARGTEFVDLTSPHMAVITLKRADIIMYLIKGKITKYM